MGLKLITPPAAMPLTLEEAKAHLRVVANDEDNLIGAYLAAATANVEAWLGRVLVDQTWDYVLDAFPGNTVSGGTSVNTSTNNVGIQIPNPPLISVVQLAYDNTNGDEVIMPAADYFVDNVNAPGWVIPAGSSLVWPSTINASNSVRIRFRAGYINNDSPADTDVPADIKAAIMLTLGNLYEHRESQVVGTIVSKLPFGVEQLLRRHRVLLGMS